MQHEVINHKVFGKVLGRGGKVRLMDYDSAMRAAEKHNGTLNKAMNGQYYVKVSERMEEDAPANSAGGGGVAGIGVGPQGEPGVLVTRQKKKVKDGMQDSKQRQSAVMAFTRRAAPTITTGINETSDELKKRYVARATGDASMAAFTKRVATGKAKKDAEEIHRKRTKGLNLALKEEETPGSVAIGSFAGKQTFMIPSKQFNEMRMQKAKGKHWKKYIGESEHGKAIREYAKKNPKKPIILQDESTGAMCYARYGGKSND